MSKTIKMVVTLEGDDAEQVSYLFAEALEQQSDCCEECGRDFTFEMSIGSGDTNE